MNTIKNLLNLENRIVLITGANGFLGKVFANSLSELGASLVLVDHPRYRMDKFAKEIEEKWKIKTWCISCDIENEYSRYELIKSVNDEIKNLNCLINNAAFTASDNLNGWTSKFEKQSLETWGRALETNLTSAFHLIQGFTPLLRNAKGSNIINIGSIYGEYGPDWSLYEGTKMGSPAAYSVSKGGLIQLTRWLATTLAPTIRVNAICPGGIFRNQPDCFVHRYAKRTPLGRMATEDDFRGIITFLASDMSAYMTGQALFVDGGWGIW